MTREVYLAEDATVPHEGMQVALYLGEHQARILFDTEYMGLTDAFMAQAVALSIIRDGQDAVILHHPDNSFLAELHTWWDKHEE